MLKWFLISAAVYAAGVMLVQSVETSMLYHPIRESPPESEFHRLGLDRQFIQTPDGVTLDVWMTRGDSLTFLLCHGNAGSNADRIEQIMTLRKLGYSAVLFDYRGYGASSGRPTERGLYADARCIYDWLTTKVRADHIVVWGTSLGAAVAAELAASVSVRAVIIETAFVSKLAIGRDILPYFPAFLFTWDQFETIDHVSRIDVPILITHGDQDEVIPYVHGERLFDKARSPKYFLPVKGARHNDIWRVGGQRYFETLGQFALERKL